MAESKKTSVEVNRDELWLLQSVLRHEMADQEKWKIPPVSKTLNNDVAMAILFSTECSDALMLLELTENDTYTLDYLIPAGAKNSNGQMVGQPLLIKVWKARQKLSYPFAEVEEPEGLPSATDVIKVLKEQADKENSEEQENA